MDRQRKRELRELNTRAWVGDKDVFSLEGSLDSSLKKNTAFIKRLRTAITATSLPTSLQEIRTLSLHKYLSEVIAACYEGICRLRTPGEVAAGVEVISSLHQRFGPEQFTCYLGWYIGRGLSTPDKSQLKALAQDAREKEEKERFSRQRILLRVVTELWLVGALKGLEDVARPDDAGKHKENTGNGGGAKLLDAGTRGRPGSNNLRVDKSVDAEPFPLEVLKDMLGHDRDHASLNLVVLFVKSFSWDVLGIKVSTVEGRKNVAEDGATSLAGTDSEEASQTDGPSVMGSAADDTPLTTPELQQRFRGILIRYLEDVKAHIIRDQRSLTSLGRRNAEAYVKSGEVFEDRQANFDKHTKAQEKLVSNAQILCDILGVEMPVLGEVDASTTLGNGGIGLVKTSEYLRGHGEGAGIWEDEEERRFYENLVDLKERVPGILLEDGKKKKMDNDGQVGKKLDGKPIVGDSVVSQEKGVSNMKASDTKASDAEDLSTVITNKTVGAQVDALLARLPELSSKELVDEATIDFCFVNSKASRNRLIKAVQEVPKGRSDLLPLWSRLVATLGKYMPDVSQSIVSYLDEEFRSLQRRKQKDFLGQVRTSNIRYLAELTKFGVVPEHVIFHCLKVCLEEFSRMNIEIICNLLESCGRYLLRNPETSPRMSSFLETLQRKKGAQHLGQQERMLIENAMYFVDPPIRAAIQQKERDPVDLFIRRLVYLDLNKRNYAKILKQIRKLHWEEQEVVSVLHRIFSRPGKVKYSNVHLLAILCGALFRYHQQFVISVIDDLLEHVVVGLEQNDFKFNQRRISEVKYLGELYNYKMVDSPVIFDTLYKVVTFGHEGGTPAPGRINPLDMPDDFFRVRLVCTLLDTCGMCFDRGSAKKKLDFFLTFFQYYICTKEPLPMDVEFMVQDTFSLTRPQWKLAATLEEAGGAFAEAVTQNYRGQGNEKTAEPEELDERSPSEDEVDDDENAPPDIEQGQSSSEDVETNNEEAGQRLDSDFDDEAIVVTRHEDERDPEADADFDRELAKMMAESMDSRKNDRKPLFDVPLPMRRAVRETSTAADDSPSDGAATPPNTMAFSLLTKRGNRQQTRTVELPSDSHFAVAMKTQQQAEREEQKRIKSLVMNYDLRDDNENDGEDEFHYIYPRNSNAKGPKGLERQPASHASQARTDRSGNNRSGHRARKLQLSDVDWYAVYLSEALCALHCLEANLYLSMAAGLEQ
ncbi:MAG: hypothetical protein M1812_004069 [Candelaria pacifica]|nr:MAG: hypothetical protein M1812_004069 [Candelaria pacifica]